MAGTWHSLLLLAVAGLLFSSSNTLFSVSKFVVG